MQKTYYTVFKMFNPKTGSSYIGYTNDLSARVETMISVATTIGSRDENVPVHQMLRNEGVGNFHVKVVETATDRSTAHRQKVQLIKMHQPNMNVYNR